MDILFEGSKSARKAGQETLKEVKEKLMLNY